MASTKKNYPANFKAKVALEALRETSPVAELSVRYGLHPSVNPAHKIYPYLLRDVEINKPNQVWCSDYGRPRKMDG